MLVAVRDQEPVRLTYLGLQVSWLDSVECSLTFEGARKLHACRPGLDHWPRNENGIPYRLRIDASFVLRFERYCLACALREAVWVLREHLNTCAHYLWDFPAVGQRVGEGLCRCDKAKRYTVAEVTELVLLIRAVVVRADHILRLPGKRKLEYDDNNAKDEEDSGAEP